MVGHGWLIGLLFSTKVVFEMSPKHDRFFSLSNPHETVFFFFIVSDVTRMTSFYPASKWNKIFSTKFSKWKMRIHLGM